MPTASLKPSTALDLSDEEFWAECRRRAIKLNIPAWRIAEEFYQHREVDIKVDAR